MQWNCTSFSHQIYEKKKTTKKLFLIGGRSFCVQPNVRKSSDRKIERFEFTPIGVGTGGQGAAPPPPPPQIILEGGGAI